MKLEISLCASQLTNKGGGILLGGKANPFAVVTLLASNFNEQPIVLGKTEVIKNCLNPQWVQKFVLEYKLGTPSQIAINIFSKVGEKKNGGSTKNLPMANTTFDIGAILGSRGNMKSRRMKGGGSCLIRIYESVGTGLLRLKMKGMKLKNVEGYFSKSDPFFEISKRLDAAGGPTWTKVYRSEDVHNDLNPEWKMATIELSVLCGGASDLPLRIEVFDHESSGKHIPMGAFETTLNGFLQLGQGLNNRTIKLTEKGNETGMIVIESAVVHGSNDQYSSSSSPSRDLVTGMNQISLGSLTPMPPPSVPSSSYVPTPTPVHEPTFVDYITGGCELNVAVAIDFTGSNGDPRKPGTLHHLSPNGERNDYEKAIASIVSILSKYDSDQKYPVYGFGAKYGGVVRHCFECGGQSEYHGVDGVLNAYRKVFETGLIMSRPTVFEEVIETVASRAKRAQETATRLGKQAYTVLLIVTDGAVENVSRTADCLHRVCDAPMSIVIVGVGNADFSGMRFLDDLQGVKRDIAQFVQFNKYRNDSHALTAETLDEIPAQLTGYFKSMNIPPLPPVIPSLESVQVEDEEPEIDLTLNVADDEVVVTGGGQSWVDGFAATK